MIKVGEFKERYPNTYEELNNWTSELMNCSIEADATLLIYEFNHRLLYDFFDKKGLFITLSTNSETFTYTIVSKLTPYTGEKTYSNRKEAEYGAIEMCMEILEKK